MVLLQECLSLRNWKKDFQDFGDCSHHLQTPFRSNLLLLTALRQSSPSLGTLDMQSNRNRGNAPLLFVFLNKELPISLSHTKNEISKRSQSCLTPHMKQKAVMPLERNTQHENHIKMKMRVLCTFILNALEKLFKNS